MTAIALQGSVERSNGHGEAVGFDRRAHKSHEDPVDSCRVEEFVKLAMMAPMKLRVTCQPQDDVTQESARPTCPSMSQHLFSLYQLPQLDAASIAIDEVFAAL